MNYAEFRRHLGKAGLTINEFSALMEVRPSSISNYAKKPLVPRQYAVIAVLLGDAADRGVDFRELLTRFGITLRARPSSSRIANLDEFRKRPNLPHGVIK